MGISGPEISGQSEVTTVSTPPLSLFKYLFASIESSGGGRVGASSSMAGKDDSATELQFIIREEKSGRRGAVVWSRVMAETYTNGEYTERAIFSPR